jgi:hypothetical protein
MGIMRRRHWGTCVQARGAARRCPIRWQDASRGTRGLRTQGIATGKVVELLGVELSDKSNSLENPANLPPHELAAYIIDTHHGFLRRELPRLHAMSERVAYVHGGHTPSLERAPFRSQEQLYPAGSPLDVRESPESPRHDACVCPKIHQTCAQITHILREAAHAARCWM